MNMSNIKKIVIASVSIIVVITGIWAYFYIQHNLLFRPHGTVYVISIPFDLKVTDGAAKRSINTEPVDGTSVALAPGTRTITFSANGFKTTGQEVNVEDGKTQTIYVYLEPETRDAEIDIENDEKYGYRREAMAQGAMSDGISEIKKDAPIADQLPILRKWYSLYTCNSSEQPSLKKDQTGICITFALDNDTQRKNALNEIEKLGYKLTDYAIFINGEPYTPSKS